MKEACPPTYSKKRKKDDKSLVERHFKPFALYTEGESLATERYIYKPVLLLRI
jgi:hypothetical protein